MTGTALRSAPRPFQLMIDSGNPGAEPPTRYFGSLHAALTALGEYEPRWVPFSSIIERRPGERPVWHVRAGEQL